MKTGILAILFFSSCSWKPLLKAPPNCEKIYHKIVKEQRFSEKQKKRLIKQTDSCLKKNQTRFAVLILEKLLKELKNQNTDPNEIKALEKKLATNSFYKAKNYEKALKYLNQLAKKSSTSGEWFFVQYHIAESFFHLKKYKQALRELDKCFRKNLTRDQKKKALGLKGRVFLARKQFDQAIELFKKQIESFPEEESFFREYLALTYEFRKDFLSAVRELEKIQPQTEFIQKKIHRLIERYNNQPGFKWR